ncbi:MAG: AgmX/PglI C-terminal domain-containing protein [Labilithrix sp.]|nr:AgmX/PglI C-terminal domain-containing protein [Labilithrix sp.]
MVELRRASRHFPVLFLGLGLRSALRASAGLGAGLALTAGGCKSGCGQATSDGTGAETRPPASANSEAPAPTESGPPAESGAPEAAGQLPPSIPDAKSAVNAVRPSLRACFAQQLGRTPTTRGTITFAIEVGPDGRVTAATPRAVDGLDDECVACMTAGVTSATFERPLDGSPATVIAPFTFHARGETTGALGSAPVPSAPAEP